MVRMFGIGLVMIAMGLLGGCSQYVEDYQYTPRPALAEIPSMIPGAGSPVSALASIVGVRREDKKAKLPVSIEVRLRLDNNAAQGVTFDPHSLELANGLFLKFEPPILDPQNAVTLAPGQSAVIAAYFPFPQGKNYDNTDLSALQLRWELAIDGRLVRQVVMFQRTYPLYYYDPYYYRYPWYGPQPGVVVHGTYWRHY